MLVRLGLRLLLLWTKLALCEDPWAQCAASLGCRSKFADGVCHQQCEEPECLRDGFDCLAKTAACEPQYEQYCQHHYGNTHCDHGCSSAPCGWDGSDCVQNRTPAWAQGTLLVLTPLPASAWAPQGPPRLPPLLWALSLPLRTTLQLRGVVPFDPSRDLSTADPQQLSQSATLRPQGGAGEVNGSVLLLQIDNRPCSQLPTSCFPSALLAAHFLHALMTSHKPPRLPAEVLAVMGVREELGKRGSEGEREAEVKTGGGRRAAPPPGRPAWLWVVVGVATGLAVAAVAGAAVVAAMRLRRRRGPGGPQAEPWTQHTPHRPRERGAPGRTPGEERRSDGEWKKRGKDAGRKRREPLGEDAMRLRPLKHEVDCGSDGDITQSSLEEAGLVDRKWSLRQEDDSICDHRPQEHKHFQVMAGGQQSPVWEGNSSSRLRSGTSHWCGPDGSLVLIRAVRSGLDRVAVELLRAGVPVNNTDHTGRSALHWACAVNHLSLARALLRYGASANQQDHKGETPLFLAAQHGCYDTARLLLLQGANQELADRRGRRPLEAAREGLHHQLLELLLAHRAQGRYVPFPVASETAWEDRAFPQCPWTGAAPPGLSGRSASFSGVISHRASPQYPPHLLQPPSDRLAGRSGRVSPQPSQSATALVSPRILGRQARPISTLQEVTSEAEEEEEPAREQEVARAATPHLLSPSTQQPTPRPRSFSCTQHALRHHPPASSGQSQSPSVKAAAETVDAGGLGPAHTELGQSQEGSGPDALSNSQSEGETEGERNCKHLRRKQKLTESPDTVQTVL
ncbi:neurogenic locus notch homolog protein 1 [Amia ocellicauda]|uniref:neurogenic locus notch homolog protein 1 n=1 Tax=Amia ocellicauda TaxID=2972642 RepID=UPI0034649552